MIRARWLIAVAIGLAGCSGSDPTAEPRATTAADVTTTTLLFDGTAAELLPQMATAMSELSAQVAEDGDAEDTTLATIVAIWAVVQPEVEATRPVLVGSMQTTVDMATSAVERKRPADADKAYNLLTDLIASYNSAG